MKIILKITKWIIIAGILLFSIATLSGGSYLQTLILLLIVAALIWWPEKYLKKDWNRRQIRWSRAFFILIMIVLNVAVSLSNPKETIYRNDRLKDQLMMIYEEKENAWPIEHENIYITTEYGEVHILACGSINNPPLIMLHAASMGAHSWAENLDPLVDHFRIYAIDNIGEGNKSSLDNALNFPSDGRELADLYAEIADSLGVISSHVFGASNGGFIAQNYAYYHPQRVKTLSLFGPMGLMPLSNSSVMMMALPSMYPFKFLRENTLKWAIGTDPQVTESYGEWFDCILKSTIPSFAKPVPMTKEEKQDVDIPILLFLGTNDPMVGDAELAARAGQEYPNIRIEIMESGHLIAVEKADSVNQIVREFLDI